MMKCDPRMENIVLYTKGLPVNQAVSISAPHTVIYDEKVMEDVCIISDSSGRYLKKKHYQDVPKKIRKVLLFVFGPTA